MNYTDKNILIIDGPSAVGKSTILSGLLDIPGNCFAVAKRVTTRQPRNADEDTLSYDFISPEIFRKMVQSDMLIEYKDYLFEMSYGLPVQNVIAPLSQKQDVIGMINLGNIKMVKQKFPNCFSVFITASLDTIRERLEKRLSHTESQIEERLFNAANAQKFIQDYDLVILNDNKDVESSVSNIHSAFQQHKR